MENSSLNNTAIDLSLRSVNYPLPPSSLVRPIPRLPWTITWYQSVWCNNYNRANSLDLSEKFRNHVHTTARRQFDKDDDEEEDDAKLSTSRHSGTISPGQFEDFAQRVQGSEATITGCINTNTVEKRNQVEDASTLLPAVLDVACCDGPVVFERVSNPNFALTVEHNEPNPRTTPTPTPPPPTTTTEYPTKTLERRQLALKTYVCIYCNQSFKSLFCYQKHKKRHINPVSVDITAMMHTNTSTTTTTNNNLQGRSHNSFDNKTKTKDLNVQFFPCKKCGSKFPSYYFVHKHRKVCHVMDSSSY